MTSTPHDALFKAVFSQPQHAAVELRAVLPPTLADRIDWTSLSLEPGSYVDDELRERQSDLLYRARAGSDGLLVYVLFEHQSEPDPTMAFRLLRYQVRIWERCAEGPPYPAILPVVLAHSTRGWTASTTFEELLSLGDLEAELLPFVPRFQYLVDDLARRSDEELAGRISSLYVRLVLLLLRDGRRLHAATVVERAFTVWREVERTSPAEAIGLLIRYILLVSDESEHGAFIDVVEAIGPRTREEAMRSIADKIFDEGVEEGRAEGRAEGLRETLRKLLLLRFGAVGPEANARIATAEGEVLSRWIDRVLTAGSVDEALASSE